MSLFPYATSWVGKAPNSFWPEFLYLIVILVWSGAYQLTEVILVRENPHMKGAHRLFGGTIRQLTNIVFLVSLVVVWFWPIIVLLAVFTFQIMVLIAQLKDTES